MDRERPHEEPKSEILAYTELRRVPYNTRLKLKVPDDADTTQVTTRSDLPPMKAGELIAGNARLFIGASVYIMLENGHIVYCANDAETKKWTVKLD